MDSGIFTDKASCAYLNFIFAMKRNTYLKISEPLQ